MVNWRFYGRTEELEQLHRILQLGDVEVRGKIEASRDFGQRGVGKTELLKGVARRVRGNSAGSLIPSRRGRRTIAIACGSTRL